MLRIVALLLILLNASYFAWSQGLLRAYGWAPAEQHEPERLAQQVRPEAIRILSAPALPAAVPSVAAAATPAPVATEESLGRATAQCWQAGPWDVTQPAQLEALRRQLGQSLSAGSWTLDVRVTAPARWIIYMGRYANATELDRKRAQLSPRTRRALQTLDNPELQPGLSLARFETQAKAEGELDAMQKRGLRSARVVQEWPERRQASVRVQAADAAQAATAQAALQALPAINGKAPSACAP
ncbi:SPOR domain-containing protein [Hylemonella gracilis]|uniref:SPOR domain-containing protein n=1 Tax=Hylemonella gracilis TaxID=80880 RepID=A0A4P6UIW6_9BURK|nr:SPOR domain-containing protein [Hylemonella gracilis]QBK04005.1 SPOR domain-containing protein [Hylemonella gracilis]